MAFKTKIHKWNLCSVHPNTRLSALVSKCSKTALESKLPNTCLYYMKEDNESTWWGGLQSSDWCWLPKHRLHMPSIKMAMEPSATTQSVSTAHTVIQTPTLYHFSCMPWSMWAYTRHFQIQTLVAIERVCELSHPVSNCESWRLSFQDSKLEMRCKNHNRSKWRFFFLFKQAHRHSQLYYLLNLEWYPYFEHIVQSHHSMCLLGVHLNYKTCHIPLNYRHLGTTSVWLRPADLRP